VPTYHMEKDSSAVLFFEFFQIHPIKVNLTFTTAENTSEQHSSALSAYNPLTAVLNVLIMTFGNISVCFINAQWDFLDTYRLICVLLVRRRR
jgi:hypothetical protein